MYDEDSELYIELAIPIKDENRGLYLNVMGWKKVKARKYIADLEKSIEVYNTRLGLYEGRLQRFVRILFRMLEGLKPDDLNDFLDKASKDAIKLKKKIQRRLKAKINKSLLFIKKCVETTNAKKVKNGYLVKGESGYLYLVTNTMDVYLNQNEGKLKHMCIVDDNNYRGEKWEINDGIGQRLLMLSHDKQLAKDIYENGDRLDKHWLQIMEA